MRPCRQHWQSWSPYSSRRHMGTRLSRSPRTQGVAYPVRPSVNSANCSRFKNQHPLRERPVNSATLRNERLREFCPKSRPLEGFLPDPERDGGKTESSPAWRRTSQTARNTGENEKAPRGTQSAFSVNWTGSDSSLTDFSSPGRTRTYDKAINSRLLYQLSYRGMGSGEFSEGGVGWWWTPPFVLCQCLRREK